LITQRLAAAGWHEYQAVAAGAGALDDLRLLIAKRSVAKSVKQDLAGVRNILTVLVWVDIQGALFIECYFAGLIKFVIKTVF
jgi:hypothetical protein